MTSFVANPTGYPLKIKEGSGISIVETASEIQFVYTGTGITGNGVIGQIAYFSGTQLIKGDTGLTYDPATKTLYADSIIFSTNPLYSGTTAGAMYWDNDDNTLNLIMPGGTVGLQIGQEQLIRVYNNSGAVINNGQLVYINGANGNRPTIALAGNNNESVSATTIGMATENISNNQFGYVTTQGLVRDINTNAYPGGTILYLGVSGSYTNIKTTAPNHLVVVGTVIRQHAVQGTVYANIQNGWELSELHDVYITGSVAGDLLQYSTGSVWKNTSLANLGLMIGDIGYPNVNNPPYNDLGEVSSLTLSAGVLFSAARITRQSATQVNVASGAGLFRTTNSPTGTIVVGYWAATGSFTVATNVPTYIGVSYNNGNPQVVGYSSFSQFNWYTDFPIGKVYSFNNDLHILQAEAHSEDTANLTRKMLRQSFPFIPTKAPEGGGLAIGEVATRRITLTAGGMWHGFNYYPITALNTSVSGSFSTWYKTGTSWVEGTGTVQWPNTQYNDTTNGILATMTNNKYAVLWFWVDASDSDVHMIYGINEYTSSALAEAESPPASLPLSLNEHGALLGRFIFRKSASTATSIQSALTTTFQTQGVTVHNDLSSIQGGTAGEYYHLTAAQQAQVAAGYVSSTGTITIGYVPRFVGSNMVEKSIISTTTGTVNIAGGLGIGVATGVAIGDFGVWKTAISPRVYIHALDGTAQGGIEIWKNGTPTNAISIGLSVPGVAAGDDIVFSIYSGTWSEVARLSKAGIFSVGAAQTAGKLNVTAGTNGEFLAVRDIATIGSYFSGTAIQAINSAANDTRALGVIGRPLNLIGLGGINAVGGLNVDGTIRSTSQAVPASGAGVEMIYASSVGYLTAYDRSASAYKPLNIDGSTLALNNITAGNVTLGGNIDFINGITIIGPTTNRTNTSESALQIYHRTSGTAQAGFGNAIQILGEIGDGTDKTMAYWNTVWNNATAGAQKAQTDFYIYDTTARVALSMAASGAVAQISFLGNAPVGKQVSGGTLAGVIAGLVNLGLFSS